MRSTTSHAAAISCVRLPGGPHGASPLPVAILDLWMRRGLGSSLRATAIRAEREILINLEKRRRWQSCTSPLCRVAGRFGKRRECGTDRERCRLRRYRARPGDMAIALRQRHLPPNAVAYKDDRRGAGCGATLPRPGDLPTGARHHPTEECARAEADDVLLCSPAGSEEYVALHGTITAHRSPARAEHNTSLGGV